MRLLVVEDEPRLATHLASALEDAAYAVDVAGDGERADFLARTERYDAVVLDLGLPRVDGLTVLEGWRQSGLTMPVLILTARDNWHEKVKGIDYKFYRELLAGQYDSEVTRGLKELHRDRENLMGALTKA